MLNFSIIKNLCQNNNMTLREFAKKLDMTESGLHTMISRNSTSTDTLTKISEILNVTEEAFIVKKYQENQIVGRATDNIITYGDLNVWKRIGQLQAEKDVDQTVFTSMLGIAMQTFSSMMNRKSEPGLKLVKSLFRVFPKLNPHWLLFGEGSMFIDEKSNGKCKHCDDLRKNNAVHIRYIENLEKNLEECREQVIKLTRSEVKKGKVG